VISIPVAARLSVLQLNSNFCLKENSTMHKTLKEDTSFLD